MTIGAVGFALPSLATSVPMTNRTLDAIQSLQCPRVPWIPTTGGKTAALGRVKLPASLREPAMGLSCSGGTNAFSTFSKIREQDIPALKARFIQYEHPATGAKHFHLSTPKDVAEKSFAVLVKTVPTDSTGVAHILEHSVLGGSEKYPIKNLFFETMKRSLNTRMNAFTGPDWTQFPFATQNKKDFFNLLSVYEDLVFFPQLLPEVFAQEGHRLEFNVPQDPSSGLQYNGIVYNEMKGRLSTTEAELYQQLRTHLFPTSPYRHNAGGDPQEIPNLSYEQFKAFHRKHYHPSNSAFFTYGNVGVEEIQRKLETDVLSRFSHSHENITLPLEPRFDRPITVEGDYPLDIASDGGFSVPGVSVSEDVVKDATYHMVGWVIGPTGNIMQQLEAQFLANVLLHNRAAPLLKFLEDYEHAAGPSTLKGVDSNGQQMSFILGVEGSNPEFAEDFELALLENLAEIAWYGVPDSTLESVFEQMSLALRDADVQSTPVGLGLLNKLVPAALYGADPVSFLDISEALLALGKKIKEPGYLQDLTRSLLLENPHRVNLCAKPDASLRQKRLDLEKDKLTFLEKNMTLASQQRIIAQAQALLERQQRQDDLSVLPTLGIEDIARTVNLPVPNKVSSDVACVFSSVVSDNIKIQSEVAVPSHTAYQAATNGVSHIKWMLPFPVLSPQELAVFPIYQAYVAELMNNNAPDLETLNREAAICSDIACFSDVGTNINQSGALTSVLGFETKALNKNSEKAFELIKRKLNQVSFEDQGRLQDFVDQIAVAARRGISQQAHHYAMLAAAGQLSDAMQLAHIHGGLATIKALETQQAFLQQGKDLASLVSQLESIHAKVLQAPKFALSISDDLTSNKMHNQVDRLHGPALLVPQGALIAATKRQPKQNQIWVTDVPLSACAKSFSGVPESHPDAAPLKVLANLLMYEHLMSVIRESRGVYSAGASYDQANGVFTFYSNDDPKVTQTLSDFDSAIDWLRAADVTSDMLDHAIMTTINEIDQPDTPAGAASSAFLQSLQGRSNATHNAFRSAVLAVTPSDLKRVAQKYLASTEPAVAIITSPEGYDTLSNQYQSRFERYDV